MYQYLFWHYTGGIKGFIEIWGNFIEFFWNYFSIKLLSKTLFAHWHRDISKRGRAFRFGDFFQTLAFNVLSRIIGAVVRLVVIFVGLFFVILAMILGFLFFIVWLFLPVFIIGCLILAFVLLKNNNVFGSLSFFVFAAFAAFLPWRFYLIASEKTPSELTEEEILKSSLFNLILQRAGIDPKIVGKINAGNIKAVLEEHNIAEEDFNEIISWVFREYYKKREASRFWTKENLARRRGLGKNWAYGYTINLDKFSKDLGEFGAGKLKTELIGRDEDIEIIERILSRAEENNILMIGEPGAGRKMVIQGLANLVYEGMVLPPLKHKRILEINLEALIASAGADGNLESQLALVFNEAVGAGNIILVINDFHNFVGAASGVGKMDISSFLTPYLSSKNIQIIGITDYKGLHRNMEANPGLLMYFEKVEIKEPDEKTSMLILEDIVGRFEKRSNVLVTYPALKEIVKQSARYLSAVPMPERAIDLLDESMVYAATKTDDRFLKIEHIDKILSEKTKIPIGEVGKSEKEKLSQLEKILHQRVIDQEEAIVAISRAMRRSRLGVGETKKPIGTFLFLGPTGVGKTETAKALSEAYFGSEERMVRFDMSEYQNTADIARLIGSPEGEPGVLTTRIKENPFSLVLLDELEKAHPNILNLFLQVLDEGFLTDAWGRKVNFRNTIIIATSNAGAEFIREMIEKNINPVKEKEKLMDFLQMNSLFKPEFLNRFDEIVIFHALSKENLVKIAILLLRNLAKRLAEQKITLSITPALAERVAELGYSPEYGARPMKRVIQDRVEDLISRKLLDGSLKKGDTLEIKPEEI
ncbi:MAG: AAA family ATPase [Parcubacteria group bacterium]|nr:AAA family ATPase [Parcubacteria group bacterium]